VALTRLRCYAPADKDLERMKERLLDDCRAEDGDYLLAEEEGEAVGTATSLRFKMWVRGAELACQGVAWVGAIKTMRRLGGEKSSGVASMMMREMLRKARERGEVVSALIPFRASFYEHFGYGIVERRNRWTVPMAILPTGSFEGIRFYEPGDFAARAEFQRRLNRAGQCDVERGDDYWAVLMKNAVDGLQVVDRAARDGSMRGSMYLQQESVGGKDFLIVVESVHEDEAAFRRQLCFLSSLRDQYSGVKFSLPRDLPLNWLLKESQLPHRLVNHAFAVAEPITRLQVRVLDHAKFLEGLKLPGNVSGKASVAVHECEGETKKFSVEIEGGKVRVRAGKAAANFECADNVWAAIACGEMPATRALRWGLAKGSEKAAEVLDVFSRGPAGFCNEYF
jgi:predicted acetyltransferase